MAKMTVLENGIAVLDDDTHITKWVKETGKLSHATTIHEEILPLIPNGTLVIDGGASIGDHTVAYATRASEVWAFEPFLPAYECLVHNVTMFASTGAKVECINAALSNQEIPIVVIPDASKNYGASIVGPARLVTDATPMSVRLDRMVRRNMARIGFIKLDLEGYEFFALQGALHVLITQKPTLLIEMNKGAMDRLHLEYDDVFSLLIDVGYQFRSLDPNVALTAAQYDLVCTPA